MSNVIFLNGCGSSGKTSIAKAIQYLSEFPWLTLGVDMFINMMPARYIEYGDKAENGYYTFESGKNDYGPTVMVDVKPLGSNIFDHLPLFTKNIADLGNNIIIDEVLFGDEALKSYIANLKEHRVYFIGIFCDLQSMQEREILRGDRVLGLSNAQFDIVHDGMREYDLKIDTTKKSPFDSAREILKFIDDHPSPQGFVKMRNNLNLNNF